MPFCIESLPCACSTSFWRGHPFAWFCLQTFQSCWLKFSLPLVNGLKVVLDKFPRDRVLFNRVLRDLSGFPKAIRDFNHIGVNRISFALAKCVDGSRNSCVAEVLNSLQARNLAILLKIVEQAVCVGCFCHRFVI